MGSERRAPWPLISLRGTWCSLQAARQFVRARPSRLRRPSGLAPQRIERGVPEMCVMCVMRINLKAEGLKL